MRVPEAPELTATNAFRWALFAIVVLTVCVLGGVLTVAQAGHAVAASLVFAWEFIKALGSVVKQAWNELHSQS